MQRIKRYQPSNGTEGECFEGKFCGKCRKVSVCRIICNAMARDKDDPKYPTALTYDADGNPTCTAFVDAREKRRPPGRRIPSKGQAELF